MSNFNDLKARVLSALVMVAIGAGAVWAGGWIFAALAVVLAGLMGWELWRMMAPADPYGRAEAAGLVAALLVAIFTLYQPGWIGLGGLALGALVMAGRMPRDKLVFGLYYGLILWAAHGFILLREGMGLAFMLWLILIVVAFFRELFGSGSLFGVEVMPTINNGGWYNPNGIMVLSPGAFFIIGFIIWIQRWISADMQEETN